MRYSLLYLPDPTCYVVAVFVDAHLSMLFSVCGLCCCFYFMLVFLLFLQHPESSHNLSECADQRDKPCSEQHKCQGCNSFPECLWREENVCKESSESSNGQYLLPIPPSLEI